MTVLRRSFDVEVRGVDEECRRVDFVAATESPVPTRRGPEVLRMSGLSLKRYRANPVVLDSHRMDSIEDVIGRADVKIDKASGHLRASVTFDDDDRSQRAFDKVRKGFVRSLSVGYVVDPKRVHRLRDGDEDGDVRGPALIVKGWELHEISVVPVPADAGATRRSFYDQFDEMEADMAEPVKDAAACPAQRAQEGPSIEPPKAAPSDEGATVTPIEIVRMKREAEIELAKAELRKARHDAIRALCPVSMTDYLDGLLLEDPDITVESALRALREERKRGMAPVGTAEPAPTEAEQRASAQTTKTEGPSLLTDSEALKRALAGS